MGQLVKGKLMRLQVCVVFMLVLLAPQGHDGSSRADSRWSPQPTHRDAVWGGLRDSVALEKHPERARALEELWAAYTAYQLGNEAAGLRGVEVALELDPDLAIANIVRAEFALGDDDWATAVDYYERGLSLLGGPYQPLSPVDSVEMSAKSVEVDSRCLLAYAYVGLASDAGRDGDEESEKLYLSKAHGNLLIGLSNEPSDFARDVAMFALESLAESTPPSIPSVSETEEVVQWFLLFDWKISDFRRSFPEELAALQTDILEDLRTHNSAADLERHFKKTSSEWQEVLIQFMAIAMDNRSTMELTGEVLDVAYSEAYLAAKVRVLGYFLLEKYGIQPE